MSILSGFSKFRKRLKTSDGYKLGSFWTSSETVEMGDGNTAETNLGAIQGITSSLATDNPNYALSASAGKTLQSKFDSLKTALGAYNIGTDYHLLKKGEIAPVGGSQTVASELIRIANAIVDKDTRLNTLETDNVNGGTLIFPYIELATGVKTVTDTTNDWNDFKGFVLGIDFLGGDGARYCETKYIPRGYAGISTAQRHVMGVYYSSSYTFTGCAIFDVSTQTLTVTTTGVVGFTTPRWFLYGVK